MKSAPDSALLTDWLQGLEVLHPIPIDMGLARVSQVARQAQLLQPACPVITIGGTNGKGSCVAMLEAIYQTAGYCVGAYTSPHILYFNERIRIAGQTVTDEAIVDALRFIEAQRGAISLSYFEYTTLVALYLFQQAKVDVILLEVGLGGRLDAVNILDADVALVASVDIDHTEYLGTTREQIGFEKAGIFRAGKPAICGDLAPPRSLTEHVNSLGALGLYQGRDFQVTEVQAGVSWDWHGLGHHYINLPWPHLMLSNVATALMACVSLLCRLPVSEAAIRNGIATATVAGRFQRIAMQPDVIVDVAHNPLAARGLAERIMRELPGKTIYAVFSVLQDKDLAGIVAPLKAVIKQWYIAPLACPRGRTREALVEDMQALGIENIVPFDDIMHALRAAILHSAPDACIIVFGSFYTVAKVLGEQI